MLSRMIIATRAVDLSLASADGSVPATITYKGILTDAGGNPVATTLSAVFTIYDQPLEGSAKWSERRELAADTEGRFTIALGQSTPLPASVLEITPLYLGVQVGADTGLSPRAVVTIASDARRLQALNDATAGTLNRVAGVLPDETGGVMGVRDPGGNVGGGISVTGVRDPGGNIDGAKSSS